MAKQTKQSRIDTALEALMWATEHFECMDQANAAVHCSPVRYSPITMRLAQAYVALQGDDMEDWPLSVAKVMGHEGAYELDPGR